MGSYGGITLGLGGSPSIIRGTQIAKGGLLSSFSGASAAYSLRDLGGNVDKVVRVRRDVDGDGTDKERDFRADEVQTGTLENWINGKQENTLPADVDTAAAAYSLRKVKADYSGEAVRIRRSSDDVEVDVAFDSDGNVSSSSSISTVSGSTTATTLGDFINGTDAFVHTWYDQAGSNDAVQETAANQPKIAEGGTLLDGINFNANTDGTNPDFLQVATRLGVTTDHFISAVFNGYQTDSSAFGAIINTRNGNAGYQYGIAATDNVQSFFYAGAGNNANSSSNFTLSNNSAKRLVTFDKDGNNLTGFGNATTNGISLSNGILTPSTTVTNIGVGGNVGTTTSLGLRANINELIVYETDQSDNRFKIESNINNYYGLYNDANELTQTEWQNTGAESFSSTSTDGFSFSNSSGTAFIGVTLSETLALNDSVFVSFNASGVDIPDESPQIRLRDSVSGGSASSNLIGVVQNGFNSFELTYDNSSYANGDNIVFSEGDTGGGTVTISDFKVSRIARNGFVETLYDQSANLRDAIQGTATNQPSIVKNGGIVKVNSKPAITFDGNDNFLEVDGSGSAVAYSFSPSGDMGMFIVSKQSSGNVVDSRDGAGDGIFLQQASFDTTRFRYNGDGSIDITATRDAQHFNTMTLDGTTLSASVDGGTAGTDTVTAGVSTTNNLVLGKAFSGNNSLFVDGEIQEAIFYENNKTSEKSDIETDIDNFYSIT